MAELIILFGMLDLVCLLGTYEGLIGFELLEKEYDCLTQIRPINLSDVIGVASGIQRCRFCVNTEYHHNALLIISQ